MSEAAVGNPDPASLAEDHLGLVVHVALRYRSAWLPLDELVAEGNVGLVEAARRFDVTRGLKFSTYATWWIRKYVLAALERQRAQDYTDANADGLGSGRRGRGPEGGQLQRVVSLEGDSGDDRGRPLLERVRDDRNGDPERALARQQIWSHLQGALGHLSPLEREVLMERYGLSGGPPETLQAIGRRRGCSGERVRQVEQQALRRARRMFREKRLPLSWLATRGPAGAAAS